MNFKANGKTYELDGEHRSLVKPNWEEMLLPAKDRLGIFPPPTSFMGMITRAENILEKAKKTFVRKSILEVGCNEGTRCYLLARYQDTYAHGTDIDDYTVAQSPDMNLWNPHDVDFVHSKFKSMRESIGERFPEIVARKVRFSTEDITKDRPENPFYLVSGYDVVVSWDTLEHLVDLDSAFRNMTDCLQDGGFMYHEYNPFFSVNGGHSLCTLDFPWGHCRLSAEDFRRYIKEVRPHEEKIDLNFYTKCLNRATMKDVRDLAAKYGLKIITMEGSTSYKLDSSILDDVSREIAVHYPNVTKEDLQYDSIRLLMEKE